MTRTTRVVVACVLQALLVAAAVAGPLSARLTGEELRLAVAPVDPIDPFRGAYVTLDYPALRPDAGPESTRSRPLPTGTVYVPLVRDHTHPDGDLWRGLPPTTRRPEGGRFVRCASDGWQLRCGIESLFASQEDARRLEAELADGAVARVRVDARGNAAVVGLEAGA